MTSLRDLVAQIRILLAAHPVVTINHPKPKRLWRALKKELPACDVLFNDHAVHVFWKKIPDDASSISFTGKIEKCPYCASNGIQATLEPASTARGDVERCWQCGGEYQNGVKVWPVSTVSV